MLMSLYIRDFQLVSGQSKSAYNLIEADCNCVRLIIAQLITMISEIKVPQTTSCAW